MDVYSGTEEFKLLEKKLNDIMLIGKKYYRNIFKRLLWCLYL